jgi:hypothetical protein
MKRIAWVLAIVIMSMLTVPPSTAQNVTQEHAAYQPFEHGFMLYLRESGAIFVFVDNNHGSGNFYPFFMNALGNLPNDPVMDTPPAGLLRPILGFGKVWGYHPEIRRALGWATDAEYAYMAASAVSAPITTTYNLPNDRAVSVSRGFWMYSVPLPAGDECSLSPAGTCSVAMPAQTQAAFQWYNGGFMIWRADTQSVIVFEYSPNIVHEYSINNYINLPDNPVMDNPPSLSVRPINAFGRVWGNFANVRLALGWGSSIELSYLLTLKPESNGLCFNRPARGTVLWTSDGHWTELGQENCG